MERWAKVGSLKPQELINGVVSQVWPQAAAEEAREALQALRADSGVERVMSEVWEMPKGEVDLIDDLPAQSAALIFHADGSFAIAMPTMETSDTDQMPEPVVACTELLMMLVEGELTISELCDAFERRARS